MKKVYAYNSNLGIYLPDDHEALSRQIEIAQSHIGDGTAEMDDVSYINDVDTPYIPTPDEAEQIDKYIQAAVDNTDEVVPGTSPPYQYAGEINSGEEVTVTLGYIPLVRRLEDLMKAGEDLAAYRESIYDGHDVGYPDLDDPPVPLENQQNLDFTDVDETFRRGTEALGRLRKVKKPTSEPDMGQEPTPGEPPPDGD